jgi:RNAse (barnase) inhibitor barstar
MADNRLDTLLQKIHDPKSAAVLKADALSLEDAYALATHLQKEEVITLDLDGAKLQNKEELLLTIATGLQFPSYFGHNWDALLDSLTDMGWLPAKGYVLILVHADTLHKADPQTHDMLLDVVRDAAERLHEEKPFFVKLVRVP